MQSCLLAFILAMLSAAAQAAPSPAADGLLDPTFGIGGDTIVAFDQGTNNSDFGRAIVVDAQDRIYLVGDVNVPGSNRIGVARLRADGLIDQTYGNEGNGRVVAPAAGNPIEVGSAVLDAQGHLLVAGSRVIGGSDTQFLLCRFNPAGTMTPFEGGNSPCVAVNFNLGGDNADMAEALAVQPDGRIVLAGWAATDTGTALALARLNPDGTPDEQFGQGGRTTFTGDGYAAFAAAAVHLLPDGSLLAAGTARTVNDLQFGILVHVDAAGQVDMAFGNNPGFARSPSGNTQYTDVAYDLQVERIVAVGNTAVQVPVQKGCAVCYLPGGNPVACPGGFNALTEVALGAGVALNDLLRQPDGRWLVAGAWKSAANAPWRTLLLRLGRDLELDSIDFAAPQGYIGHSYGHELDIATAVAVQGSRIVVAGTTKYANSLDYDYAVSGYAIDRIFASGMED
jgi:uncharacterized delta-60 repeat protein